MQQCRQDGAQAEGFVVNVTDRAQVDAMVQAVRQRRDGTAWSAALVAVEQAARGRDNLVPPIIAAVEAMATVGEIADTLRRVFGEYQETGLDL